jgi:drug/metabolite transporter (DMT)-like permease
MAAIGLSLTAAYLWGVSDYLAGIRSRQLAGVTVLLVVEATGVIGAAVAVGLDGGPPPSLPALGWAVGAGAAGAVGLLALYRAMSIGQISVVAPISACGAGLPVVVGLASGEAPGSLALAGIALALAGCSLAARTPRDDARSAARASILLAVLAAGGVGLYFTGMSYAVADGGVWWPLLDARIAAVVVTVVALRNRGMLPRMADLPRLAPVGLTDLGASVAYALATIHGLLTLAAVLAALYPVVSVLLARVGLGERLDRGQATGVLLALVGVCLMATS